MEPYLFAQGNTYLELYKLLWSYYVQYFLALFFQRAAFEKNNWGN